MKENMLKLFQNFFCSLLVSSSLSMFANIETAQTNQIDSLKKLISIHELSADKVDLLNNLAKHQIVYAKYDSAKVTIDKSIFLSQELAYQKGEGIAYCYLAQVTSMMGDRHLAIKFHDISIRIHEAASHHLEKAYSLTQKGKNFQFLQKKEEAIECLNQALSIQQALGNQNGIADVYGVFGLVYDDGVNTARALDYYFKCINIKESLELDTEGKAHLLYAYANIGLCYWNQKNYDKTIKYNQLALIEMMKLGDKANASIVNVLLGSSYFFKGQYDKVEFYALKALELGQQANYDYSIGYAYYLLARLQIIASDSIDSEANIAHLDSARSLFRKQELICDKISNIDGLIRSIQGLAEIHLLKGEFNQAINVYEKSDSIAKSNSLLQLRMDAQKGISDAYFKIEYFQKAFIHYKIYDSIDDTIMSLETRKDILEIEADNDLKQLKRKEREEQEVINSRNFLQYSAIFVFLVFLFLFFNFSGKFNLPIIISKVGIFITVIICFEFILVYLDPFVDSYTGGSPLFKLLINVSVAALIYPLQNILEHRMKN